jgi:hypothetical protein
VIDVEMRIVGGTTVSDPLIVPGVNVRNFRMTLLVHGNVVLGRGPGLLKSAARAVPARIHSNLGQSPLRKNPNSFITAAQLRRFDHTRSFDPEWSGPGFDSASTNPSARSAAGGQGHL